MTEEDFTKGEQKSDPTEENKSAANNKADNSKDQGKEVKEKEDSPDKKKDVALEEEKDDALEEKREDALENAKEKFLDTKEKLIEANKDMEKPGNREYLSFYIYQREWKPTKPIGPITAQDKGPGPAGTNLPSTIGADEYDVRKPRSPTFKFGKPSKNKNLRRSQSDSDGSGTGGSGSNVSGSGRWGPGPAAYDTRQLTNKGKDECRAPRVGARIKSPATFMTPGPAAYFRGEGDATVYPHSPAFSMRPRTKTKRTVDTPDPGSYNLPSTLGFGKSPFAGGPAFSMGGRLDKSSKKPKKYPGPGEYNLVYPNANKQKPPSFSMGGRISSRAIGTVTPGPASNELHLVKFHKPATPRFSFGIRHSPFKAIQTFAAEE